MEEEKFDLKVSKEQLNLIVFALEFCVGRWKMLDFFVPRSLVEDVMRTIIECRGRMAAAERLAKEED